MAKTDDLDELPSPEEQAEARRLASLVDGLLAGEPPPGDLPPAERDLLAAAARVHATRPLPPGRREALLGEILGRRSRRVLVPWAMAALCAAAALLLVLRPPPAPRRPTPPSASALVGRIERAQDGDARARLDLVYAERLADYRRSLLDGRVR